MDFRESVVLGSILYIFLSLLLYLMINRILIGLNILIYILETLYSHLVIICIINLDSLKDENKYYEEFCQLIIPTIRILLRV